MAIKQISVLLGNTSGSFDKLCHILDLEDISTKAVSAASTAENSMLRLVVNDSDPAASLLKSYNFNVEVTPVLAVEVPLHTGGMNAILKPLSKAEINIQYIYTTINRIGSETILIIDVDKLEEAKEILEQNWIHRIGDEIYSIP